MLNESIARLAWVVEVASNGEDEESVNKVRRKVESYPERKTNENEIEITISRQDLTKKFYYGLSVFYFENRKGLFLLRLGKFKGSTGQLEGFGYRRLGTASGLLDDFEERIFS